MEAGEDQNSKMRVFIMVGRSEHWVANGQSTLQGFMMEKEQ